MQNLVTRFHVLLISVTLALTTVGLLRVPQDFVFPAHWSGSVLDMVWPREVLLIAPLVQAGLIGCFVALGRLLSKNQFAKSQHILDPTLTLLMTVVAATQLGFLLTGIGSDLDFIRVTAVGLGGALILLGVVLFEAERHTYAGLRMPWPVSGDRAWRVVHQISGTAFLLGGVGLLALAWFDAGAGLLILGFATALFAPALLAAAATLLMRSRAH